MMYARMYDRVYGNRLSRERKRKFPWEKFSLRTGGFETSPARFRLH
jgi:hypothetical protein